MGIGADDAVARNHDALLRQKGMLNAHAAYVEEIFDVIFPGKGSGLAALFRSFNILIRCKMIQHKSNAGVVKNGIGSTFFKFIDGYRGSDIVAQNHIQFGVDQLARLHMIKPCVCGQYFLGHGHSHEAFLLFVPFVFLHFTEIPGPRAWNVALKECESRVPFRPP